MARLALLFAVSCTAAPVAAQQYENPESIDQAVAMATGVAQGQPGGAAFAVDRRLKLARCAEPLVADPPALGAIAVRCASAGWRIRVPLVTAPSTQAKPDAASIVERGETIELRIAGVGFEVTTTAIALSAGSLGMPIRVKSPTGRDPVMAIIAGPGVAEVSR